MIRAGAGRRVELDNYNLKRMMLESKSESGGVSKQMP
jgi:hypothetical protein